MVLRRVQLDRSAMGVHRGVHGMADEAHLQARCAGGAETRREARLHAAGERRAREDHDDAVSADRGTRARGAAVQR